MKIFQSANCRVGHFSWHLFSTRIMPLPELLLMILFWLLRIFVVLILGVEPGTLLFLFTFTLPSNIQQTTRLLLFQRQFCFHFCIKVGSKILFRGKRELQFLAAWHGSQSIWDHHSTNGLLELGCYPYLVKTLIAESTTADLILLDETDYSLNQYFCPLPREAKFKILPFYYFC